MSERAIPRFGGWAADYARWRPNYPEWIFERLAAAAGAPLDHVVELGAGAGQATGDLLKRFGRVTVVEPDADMAAQIPPDDRLEVRVQKAETAEFAPGSVDAVCAITSFHWMDQLAVSRAAGTWLRPGGAFLAVSYGLVRVVAPGKAEAAYRRAEAGWRGVTHRIVRDWRSYDGPMRESGAFSRIEKIKDRLVLEWPAERAAGFYVTTSFGAARALEMGGHDAFRAQLTHAFGGEGAMVRMEGDFSGAIGWA